MRNNFTVDMVHHNDKIFEGMETYGIDREVVWSYEFSYDKNPNDWKKKSDVFLGEMMIFFWLIVSRGKSNEENKLKIVTSLRFYG